MAHIIDRTKYKNLKPVTPYSPIKNAFIIHEEHKSPPPQIKIKIPTDPLPEKAPTKTPTTLEEFIEVSRGLAPNIDKYETKYLILSRIVTRSGKLIFDCQQTTNIKETLSTTNYTNLHCKSAVLCLATGPFPALNQTLRTLTHRPPILGRYLSLTQKELHTLLSHIITNKISAVTYNINLLTYTMMPGNPPFYPFIYTYYTFDPPKRLNTITLSPI